MRRELVTGEVSPARGLGAPRRERRRRSSSPRRSSRELCGWLALPVLGILLGYSYAKRFTWACHLWLGVAQALAPIGVAIALTGDGPAASVVLGLGVGAWIAGLRRLLRAAGHGLRPRRGAALDPGPLRRRAARSCWARGLHVARGRAASPRRAPSAGRGAGWLAGTVVLAAVIAAEHVARRAARRAPPRADRRRLLQLQRLRLGRLRALRARRPGPLVRTTRCPPPPRAPRPRLPRAAARRPRRRRRGRRAHGAVGLPPAARARLGGALPLGAAARRARAVRPARDLDRPALDEPRRAAPLGRRAPRRGPRRPQGALRGRRPTSGGSSRACCASGRSARSRARSRRSSGRCTTCAPRSPTSIPRVKAAARFKAKRLELLVDLSRAALNVLRVLVDSARADAGPISS